MCKYIVANNEIIIFTNETDLTIYKLIKYKHTIPTYVPYMHIVMFDYNKCVIAIINVKIARIIIRNIDYKLLYI